MEQIKSGAKSRSGLGLLDVLGIIFITLKVLGLINWSWWLVLAPFWATLTIVVLLLIVLALLGIGENKK
ncbi:MAG: hypothetical protein WBA84_03910 [Carnobacterium sp.]|uniref:hypothetical protein n=1 Tax=Carnobacterium sp. TaxID=48221 RepID=UPI003C74C3A7